MNAIRKEIEEKFAVKSGNGAYSIQSCNDYAWVLRQETEYGVFVRYAGEDISESFSGASLYSRVMNIEDEGTINTLVFSCTNSLLRNEFSLVCEDFLSFCEDESNSNGMVNSPMQWWKNWKDLLGDAQKKKMIYDIVGELMSVLKLCELGQKPFWSATRLGTHDIELEEASYEVKSTLKKDRTQIHVSSQFQLSSEKPLYLIFTRLEESDTGDSIDELLEKIGMYEGSFIKDYNKYLEERGLNYGNHNRKKKYVILEQRKYAINENFPKISATTFSEGKLPKGISHVEYDVSLDGLPFENWK